MSVRQLPTNPTKLEFAWIPHKPSIRPSYRWAKHPPFPSSEDLLCLWHQGCVSNRWVNTRIFFVDHHCTPWGHYRWTRFPFGISSAPEKFQRRLHDVLIGMEGVVNIANDIIVISRCAWSLEDTTKDHDHTVLNLLARLSQHNFKLNPDRIQCKTSTAQLMDHVLTPGGLRPTTEIVTAVLDMPQPQRRQPPAGSWGPSPI